MDQIFELDLAVIWRQVNMVLALVTIVTLVRWWKWRHYFNSQEKAFVRGGLATAVATILGSAHLIFEKTPFTIGIPLATIALPFFIYGSLKEPDRITHPVNRPPD